MSGMLPRLEQAVRSGPLAVESLLAATTFPHVEGRTVTFVFRGEAQEVTLQHWIHGLPGALPFRRLRPGDLWALQIDLPPGSRMEYKIGVVQHGRGALLRDPLNDHAARDPFGANSVVYGDGYAPPDWVLEDADARKGSIEDRSIDSRVFDGPRPIKVYLPARFRQSRRYPLLVVHDGFDFLQFAALHQVLDNLIHRLEIPPLVAALTQPDERGREYAADPRHAEYLVAELVPQLERLYPLVKQPAARGLLGASFGAVASLHAAWRHPGFFGKLLLQSGSFVFTEIGAHDRGPMFDPVVEFVNAFRRQPGKPAEQVFQSCGVYESLIYYNRSLVPLLQDTGMTVRYREANDGHNWENWR
ncbi:MAG TPA: alpha/beta hydrolase-fold protein, partial [Planctomycetota bacterium]|nr:alpha/beta hydrolase-fold protein [Planctomycetota bacterium]